MPKDGFCPECHAPVGPTSGTDPYKHCINCFNLRPGRPADMIEQAKRQSQERERRVTELLALAD